MRDPAVKERAYYWVLGALTLFLASTPYLYGWLHTPPGMVYTGFSYNIDDSCVYLSWMRQAQNGHFFLHNQFSTDPQRGVLFNLFFLALGVIVRVTHLAPIAVYHAARVFGGAGFLAAVVGLLRQTTSDARARRIGYAFLCFAAGLGWLWGGYVPERSYGQPIDVWQPEAISFLSLYFAPLFACALALMVVFMASALRTEHSGRLRDAWPAMLAGALLGNFHSYDVIHLFAVWFVYRIVRDGTARRFDLHAWLRLVVVGVAALPTTAYVYWATQVEPVFHQRAFASPTLSPHIRWDLAGFGIPVALAAWALAREIRQRRGERARNQSEEPPATSPRAEGWGRDARLFLLTWAVVGIAVAYIPLPFQRKMLMGAHVPICLLAGAELAALTANLPGSFPAIAAFVTVVLAAPSNVLWMLRDIDRISANVGSTSHPPYLKRTEVAALDFLQSVSRPEDAVLVSPDASAQNRFPGVPLMPYLSVFVPAMAGNVVFDGHWSETADYGRKLGLTRRFFRATTDDTFRRALLADNGIRYVLYDNRLASGVPKYPSGEPVIVGGDQPYLPVDWLHAAPPPYLTPVYRNAAVTLFQVE